MKAKLPDFERRPDVIVPRGDRVYSKTVDRASFFVILEVNEDWDSFNVSLAYDLVGGEFVYFAALKPTDRPIDGKMRFALYRLWDPNPGADPWYWQVRPLPDPLRPLEEPPESELLSKVDELADDVVERIRRVGLPHFESRMAGAEA